MMSEFDSAESLTGMEIAIVGMAGRFPGAADLDAFWRNLREGVESVGTFSDAELLAAGADAEEIRDPLYVRAGAVLEEAERFDAGFFGVYPREAEIMDPQQRVLLEVAWEALEHAGYDPGRFEGAIGVFAGQSMPTYLVHNLLRNRDVAAAVHPYHLALGNDKDFLATRVAYKLNLRGPAVVVQTACSTSLVAVHLACQNLLNFGCDMALAGGVSIRVPQQRGYRYQEGGIASPDGRCRAFDAEANGTVGGNGAGLVVLKRLADALEHGDTIHAVIRGSAINNDGADKVGYTAPSVDGQAEVIATAQAVAGVDPETIGYVEAHGTGTALGDPIEIAALSQVFRQGPWQPRTCAIGAVKTNIGHLDAAAGVTGLIKAALAVRHGAIPPTLHFRRPNPRIDLDRTPFYIADTLGGWPVAVGPRRAGVSSFGIGGTNAHVVLEEPPAAPALPAAPAPQLLVLSARSRGALDAAAARLARHLRDHPEIRLADVAHTLQVGRRAFGHRRAILVRDAAEAADALERGGPAHEGVHGGDTRPVAMMFTGQGAQYAGMGAGLYRAEPAFRNVVDHCAEILRPHLGLDIRDVLFPPAGGEEEATALLDQTRITQPALFVVEYATAQLWMEWGVRPEAMIGHSIGELVAACVAGVFSLRDALLLVAERGRLMQAQPAGAMLSVFVPAAEADGLATGGLTVAASNAPGLSVVAGPTEEIEALERLLAERGVESRRLRTSHAFHSAMMEGALAPFADRVAGVELAPPSIPFVSNVTGTWITDAEATDPEYWSRQLRAPVRFADGIAALMEDASRILLEVGPGSTLASLARLHPAVGAEGAVLTSLRPPREAGADEEVIRDRLARLWVAGGGVDWAALHRGSRRRRVPLPTYAWERERFWVDPDVDGAAAPRPSDPARRHADVAEWFRLPTWTRAARPAPAAAAPPAAGWLVLGGGALGEALAERLRTGDAPVVRAVAGDRLTWRSDGLATLRLDARDDVEALLADLRARGVRPDRIVHLAGAERDGADPDAAARGFGSLVALAAALDRAGVTTPVRIDVVTAGVHAVTGDEALEPLGATALGPCRVIPQEYRNILCRQVDLAGGADPLGAVDALLDELGEGRREPTVALRGRHRWTPGWEPAEAAPVALTRPAGAAYLITGGLGRLGGLWADFLADAPGTRLALVGRTPLPPRDGWDAALADPATEPRLRDAMERVRALEAAGAEVLLLAADVADPAQLGAAVRTARERFGALHGVVHAAGVVGAEAITPLRDLDRAAVDLHFRAKVHGVRNLAAALEGVGVEWVALQSSLSAVLGGLGFAAYAGANAFLDAFAEARRGSGGTRWISVGWDGWRFGDDAEHGGLGAQARELAIREAEAPAALARLFALAPEGQLAVSTGDLAARLDRWAHPDPATSADADAPSAAPARHPRPALATPLVAPRTETEHAIAAMWEGVLGIAPIGVDDDFFELGGHSLIATQLVSRMRDAFRTELPLKRLFETPTVAALAAMVDGAGSNGSGRGGAGDPPVQRIPRDGELPLSPAQARLLFLEELLPGSTLYNNAAAVHLAGPLDVATLDRAIAALARRHEVLRTAFVGEPGRRVPVIRERVEVPIRALGLDTLDAEDREAEIRRVAVEEGRRPFDLDVAPLLRVTLLRLSEEEHVVVLVMHHIISDGWSVGVLVRELGALYAALRAGRTDPLPPLDLQYVDFAAWQREWLRTEALEAQLGFWRDALAGAPPVLELPTDRPRTPLDEPPTATHRFRLPRELADRARALAQAEGATLFMTLLAAWSATLSRFSGQTDLTIGTPVAGRTRSEWEALIGFFVNTLVLRTDLSGDPSFRELLGRVRTTALGAFSHQDVPFEQVVEAVQPERSLGHTPLFQVMFALQNTPAEARRFDELRMTPMEVDTGTAKFDLSLLVEEEEDGLAASLIFNATLWEAGSVERIGAAWVRLLETALADPDLPVERLPILTDAERARLEAWGAGAPALAADRPVHLLVREQAKRTPDAVAVTGGGASLTYAELDRRAAALARTLRRHGVGREDRVAVCLDRSPELVVALLAVLEAGGAYLPLDLAYPPERLRLILRDAEPVLLLTRGDLLDRLPEPDLPRLRVDDPAALAETEAEAAADAEPVALHDAAYLIYTSGSTGTPKGVVVEHGALAGHALEVAEHFGLGAGDRVLQFASLSFDPSLEQILPTLLRGATLVLRGEEGWAPAEFGARLAEEGVTVANVPPAFWQQWMQESARRTAAAAPGRLRLVIVGGDVMPVEGVRLWREGPFDRVRLLNAYGPTEATVTAATWELPAGWDVSAARVPIGRPLGARHFRVLDARGEPVPAGVAGELFIGGPRLARGYRGLAELTAERFVADPLRPGERLYRTGDRVRWLPDGSLEFVGRADEQLKLRGFRIEPAEIEVALERHPGVAAAAVAAHDRPGGGDRWLVGYVVAAPGTERTPEAAELRAFLRQSVPEFMVPAVIVGMEALPLNPSGKVDRGALPPPPAGAAAAAAGYVAPSTPVEERLAAVWAGVLGVERVGIHDNFFELGGHSLLATQLVTRVRDEFAVELPLRRLFETPTVAELGILVAQSLAETEDEGQIADLLAELDDLSDDEVRALLADLPQELA